MKGSVISSKVKDFNSSEIQLSKIQLHDELKINPSSQ